MWLSTDVCICSMWLYRQYINTTVCVCKIQRIEKITDRWVNLSRIAHTAAYLWPQLKHRMITPNQSTSLHNPPPLLNCIPVSPLPPRLPTTAAAIQSLQACTMSAPLAQASTAAALLCPLVSWLFFFHDGDRSVRCPPGRQLQRLPAALAVIIWIHI
jgi:hypothetical protein